MMMMAEVSTVIEVDYSDAQKLMKIAQAEAGNQGVDGMALVMQTVYNRTTSDLFPDTIEKVISQKLGDCYQFETYANGTYQSAVPSAECHLALAEFESGVFGNQPIIGFEMSGYRSLDKYFEYAFTLKGHDFYTLR